VKARLLLVASSESIGWLGALLVPSLGTKPDNESLKIALNLHLGAPLLLNTLVFMVLMLMFFEHVVCFLGVMVAVSHNMAGRLGNSTESAKVRKYSTLTINFHFFPSLC